jgi:lipoate-protein ligase A
MKAIWRLLLTPPAKGAWNMAVDEAILEAAGRGESRPTLRLYSWNPPCLSLGHAQPVSDIDQERLRANSWESVRRITGGRAILHTDEVTYSVTGPVDEPRLMGSVLESYNRLAKALLSVVMALGVPVEVQTGTVKANGDPNPVCFEVPSTYEITVRGKKLIGSAQARRKDGVLQHGSLPLSGDLTRICEVLHYQGELEREAARQRLLARATTVESVLGRPISWERAAQVFAQKFETRLGIMLKQEDLTNTEKIRIEELVQDKYTNRAWTNRV